VVARRLSARPAPRLARTGRVGACVDGPRAEAIVRSTIDLARNLGLTVVAEGIETEAVLNHLIGLGCDTGKGYLISRPQPANQLTSTLSRSGKAGSTLTGTYRAQPKLTRV
jgi:EAL domain-containing protein (putative c-di-GMP-specific phosphodiesterase class I)